MISIDFETYLISKDMPIPKPICVSWAKSETDFGLIVGHREMALFLSQILEDEDLIIAHNTTFETLVIYTWFPELREKLLKILSRDGIYCTQIYEELLNNIRFNMLYDLSLAGLVKEYFKIDISESKTDPNAWRLRYSKLDGIPLAEWPPEAVKYAIDDSIWALKMYKSQPKHRLNWADNVRAGFFLNKMGKTGILTNPITIAELKEDLETYLTPRKTELVELGFVEIGKSGKFKKKEKKLREHILDKYKGNILRSEKGTIQIGAEALISYQAIESDQILKLFEECAEFDKIYSTYIPPLEAATADKGLIYSDYKPAVTSNRTSSKGSKFYPSVNIQNAPRSVNGARHDVRNCYIPRPGYKIFSIDYAGLELASCANQLKTFYGSSAMADAINEGDVPTDLHSRLGVRLANMDGHNVTIDEFMASKGTAPFKEYRQLAKPIGLGFPGGIGYDTIRAQMAAEDLRPKFKILQRFEDVDYHLLRKLQTQARILRGEFSTARLKQYSPTSWAIVLDDVVKFKRALMDIYPDLEKFLYTDHECFLNGKTKRVKNEFGIWELEPLYKYNVNGAARDNATYTAFCNGYLMQTPSAVGAKKMVNDISQKYEGRDDVHLLAFVHDEIIGEVLDNSSMYDTIKDISYLMIDNMQIELPQVRITVEAELMDRWAKAGGFWKQQFWKDKRI